MSYVDNNLMTGENVVYKAKIHWVIFTPGIFMFAIGIYLLTQVNDEKGMGAIFGGLVLFFSLYSLLKALITKVSTELAVTSKRVIAKFGLIRRNTVELNHSKVESLSVDQSILGRLLDFGTLVINGTGGGKTPIPSIDSPLDFRREAMEVVDGS